MTDCGALGDVFSLSVVKLGSGWSGPVTPDPGPTRVGVDSLRSGNYNNNRFTFVISGLLRVSSADFLFTLQMLLN